MDRRSGEEPHRQSISAELRSTGGFCSFMFPTVLSITLSILHVFAGFMALFVSIGFYFGTSAW